MRMEYRTAQESFYVRLKRIGVTGIWDASGPLLDGVGRRVENRKVGVWVPHRPGSNTLESMYQKYLSELILDVPSSEEVSVER